MSLTMRNTLLLPALLLMLAVPVASSAQDTRYRVEVIVLTHLGHAEAPQEVTALRDYNDAIDFLAPPANSEDAEAPAEAPAAVGDEAADGAAAEPEPPAVVHIEELGDVMRDAWRRLRLSAPFRPLVSLAWEQGRDEPFPVLRLHDATLVRTDDPWAAIRERLAAGEPIDAWIDAGLVPDLPPQDGAANATDADPANALLGALPPPRRYYALDGTVSLVRSRFLHLQVDLQQREAVETALTAEPLVLPRGLRTMPAATPQAAAPPAPGAWRVFDMQQSRQVKSGQIEYFDGPVLSVLAYITPVTADENAPQSD
jgi:hypothetical protein